MSTFVTKFWSGKESMLPWLPRPIKVLIFLIFLVNAKSWPFVWHVKVWYPAILAHIRARRLGLKPYYRHLRLGVPLPPKDAAATGRGHKFEHPLGVKCVKQFNAGFDDCDYNHHLSNSSYAKNLDSARMKACIELFSPLFAPGGWMALGAAHYHYIKEIPMFSDYEIQFSIGGFEDKWIYLVAEFVTYPKAGDKKSKRSRSKSNKPTHITPEPANQDPSSSTSAVPIEPTNLLDSHDDQASPDSAPMQAQIEQHLKSTASSPRKDGGVLNCFSVSVYCFKMGRLTVPPRVALSFCGYGDASNWTRAEKLITTTPDRGRKWLQSGYKDEPIPVGIEWEGDEVFARGKSEGAKLKSALEGMREVVASVDKV